ncbi:MAG TPA: response regulator [Minicystis sp.]|nr:response regulator [Minicystis sp.]
MKHAVLFVDDDPLVLRALERALHRDRARDYVFACGAQQALAELERTPFDAVVTDVRMPGTDGVSLLWSVREHYPAARRIVLSGQVDHEAYERVRDVAHAVLAKPCAVNDVRAALDRELGAA